MSGTAEVNGVWSPKERPDITLACGDCRAKLGPGVKLADVRTLPFGASCQVHPHFFTTPGMAATNALDLPNDEIPTAVLRAIRAAATEAPSNTIYVGEERNAPAWDIPLQVVPGGFASKNTSSTISSVTMGPVTRIAADLLCAWSHGDPDKINPPDQSVAAAVDYATRLVALTGGK